MKINRLLKKIHYLILALIPCGWVLNWKYYFSRFQSEGFEPWVGFMISCILVIFASSVFAAYRRLRQQKNKIWVVFLAAYLILAFYSVNCTTAGQYWDQQLKNKESNIEQTEKDNQSFLLVEYKKKMESLQSEYDKLNSVKDASIENLGDLYYYKNTTKTVEESKTELKTEIKEYEKKIEIILEQNKVSAKEEQNKIISKSLYEFYYKDHPERIQFIFQVLLAIIIESIAQVSIYIFMSFMVFEKEKLRLSVLQNELKHFAVHAWEGINRSQSDSLVDKNIILENVKKICRSFDEKKYRQIMSIAVKKGLIKKKGNRFYPGSSFVDCDYFYSEMCRLLRFSAS